MTKAMDDGRHVEMDETSGEDATEHGIEPVGQVEISIEAAIEEAAQAVEDVNRRRQAEPAATTGGPGSSEEVEALQDEVGAVSDRLLRTLADFDNYRKRSERERSQDRKYATVEILREVLSIVDNMERAIGSGGEAADLKLGLDMILHQMEDLLRRFGVTRVEAIGRGFNPEIHEAVSRVEDAETVEPTVIEEFQPGYLVHDRLLRPAIVRVAMPAAVESSEELGQSEQAMDEEEVEDGTQ